LIDDREGVSFELYDFGLGSIALVGVEIWGVLCYLKVKMPREGNLGREWGMKEGSNGHG